MLEAGEIDAVFTPRAPSSFVRGTGKVRRLFEDTYAAERAYYERTKIFPIMHVVVIRRDLYLAHRWVAQSLFKGFVEAQRMAYEDLHQTAALKVMLPWLIRHVADTEKVMGRDFWAYGYAPNVDAIETLLRYHYQQGLSRRQLKPQEIFAPETLESSRSRVHRSTSWASRTIRSSGVSASSATAKSGASWPKTSARMVWPSRCTTSSSAPPPRRRFASMRRSTRYR